MSNLSNVKNFIGVDISKDTLDICVLNYKLAKQSKVNLDQTKQGKFRPSRQSKFRPSPIKGAKTIF